ncbi:DUF2631 domain-containing protein [uncultured Jatrophihabitans sp.]|uniref:DUF2631 domain-containing protein n=1 Tax=uncultured Jatrophihabitans sp. TaxID=1610747 RepID=UPI0035C9ED5C
MATRDTHGEQPDVSLPADYLHDHPEEHPEDWGWHGEFGVWAQVAGWVTVVILVLMMTATHYNLQGTLFLGLTAGLLVVGLLFERQRRKNAWRK